MNSPLFQGLGVSGADDDPFGLGVGTWDVTITKVEVLHSKAGNLGMRTTFTAAENGKEISQWNNLPDPENPKPNDDKALSFLKRFLQQLEVPEARMDNITEDDLIGMDCVIIVRKNPKNPDFNQIADIKRKSGMPMGSDADVNFEIGELNEDLL